MNKIKFTFASLALALSACGGTSGGTSTETVQDPPVTVQDPPVTVLKTFSDGSGVARAEATENGTTFTAVVMGADIANYASTPGDAVDTSNVTYAGSNIYGDFYSGTATINGTLVSVVAYEDNTDSVAIVYGASAVENALVVIGEKPTNIPSGSYIYRGTNVIGLRDGSYAEDGTFAMNVNFDAKTASLSGSTDTTTVGGTNIPINTSTGTFQSDVISINLNGTIYVGSLYGGFHGSGATGVTGIYHENASDPLVAGAIAGTR